MVANAPTARVTGERRLLQVVAACDSTLERLDGSKNPALVARVASVRLTRVRALLRLAETRTARSPGGIHCDVSRSNRSSRIAPDRGRSRPIVTLRGRGTVWQAGADCWRGTYRRTFPASHLPKGWTRRSAFPTIPAAGSRMLATTVAARARRIARYSAREV